jgi:diguanylate cyclase (GGDEF)-like protein/PAS domain S-box-containing protein
MEAPHDRNALFDVRLLVRVLPGACYLLGRDLCLVEVSDDFLHVQPLSRDELLGRNVFEVFPDNPDDPEADGVRNLLASLRQVLDRGVVDTMPAQRYDVAEPDGQFVQRWWQPTNRPVRDETGTVQYVLHQVVEVTNTLTRKTGVPLEPETSDRGDLADRRELATAHRDLKEAEERYRQLLEAAPDAMVVVDIDGVIAMVNAQTENMFGYGRDELIGHPVEMLIAGSLREQHIRHRASYPPGAAPRQMGTAGRQQHGLRRDGTIFPVEVSLSPVQTREGPLINAAVRDVAVRTAAESLLRDSEERFRLTLELAPIGMATVGLDGRWLRVNAALCELLGYTEDELMSLTFQDITHPDDLDADLALVAELLAGKRTSYQMDKRYRRGDGQLQWASLHVTLVRGPDGQPQHFLAHIVDVGERRRQSQQLEELARTDRLTGLANRASVVDAISVAQASGRHRVALLLLDLDHFKTVNDVRGHRAGDALLVEVANRLTTTAREGTVVARFGGDEFAVLLTDPDAADHAVIVAQRVLAALSAAPVSVPTSTGSTASIAVTGSLGVAYADLIGTTSPDVTAVAEELYRQADVALYEAKGNGRDQLAVFDSETAERQRRRVATETMVRDAIAGRRVVAFGQPIFDVRSGQQVGYEALARIVRPNGDVVLPGVFLPPARDVGLQSAIDLIILEQVLVEIESSTDDTGSVHVNVSAETLAEQHWWDLVSDSLTRCPHVASRLFVELTEQTLLTAPSDAAATVDRLREAGVKVGLDDFGTGYSALSTLQNIGVDFLKLDKSLVDGIGLSSRADTLAEALITLAHALGLDVIAEGVSMPEQLDQLRGFGCDQAQGFLLGIPAARHWPHIPMPRQTRHARVGDLS